MKRHSSLSGLSRDHHPALIAAQICKIKSPAYVGLPSEPAEKKKYILSFWKEELQSHFRSEEELLIPLIAGRDAELDDITKIVLRQHLELTQFIRELESAEDVESALDNFGYALDEHVRLEERVWFEMIQNLLDEKLLVEIGENLNSGSGAKNK
ncbi:MAG: hemerythrin domain-containing protein [Melioribacteraceae bacterium]